MTCPDYKILSPGGDCIHYDEEDYSGCGYAEFCTLHHRLLYNLKDKDCPHRPVYVSD